MSGWNLTKYNSAELNDKTSSKCTQIKQKWFTQSQKKKDLNRVSNAIQGVFCWDWENHSGKLCNAKGIKAINHILIHSKSEKGTLTSNARNNSGRLLLTLSEIYNTNGIKTGSSKNIDLLKVKGMHSWIQLMQQDSATRLLKSSKSLLQMHETENYCKQTWETKSDTSKYWAIYVLQLFVNQAVTS